jgi:DNA-binding NarL/FixJ family response regulator
MIRRLIVATREQELEVSMGRERTPMARAKPARRPQDRTPREQQILRLIWSGLKNREIATRLKLSIKTVEAHRATVMKKVRVSNTAQLLKAAIEDHLI